MIDFHSHVLPDMDDGAKTPEISLAMLRAAAKQGAEVVVATPHFYWEYDSINSFLERRQRCYDQLRPLLTADCPSVLLGAEVRLSEGLSRMDLRPLCLQGTDILLLELPFMRAPHWLLEEVENIVLGQRLTVMFAHLDRYMTWYKSNDIAALTELPGVIVQLNAETLADKRELRQLLKWLPPSLRLVVGSDMHDMGERAPQLAQAMALLARNRVGRMWLQQIRYTAREIMEECN
ncbi:MAG: hypothetical protein IJ518_08375 [Clostridia bacterium]|nr:hypothetical protein [Clostridia bacterium]